VIRLITRREQPVPSFPFCRLSRRPESFLWNMESEFSDNPHPFPACKRMFSICPESRYARAAVLTPLAGSELRPQRRRDAKSSRTFLGVESLRPLFRPGQHCESARIDVFFLHARRYTKHCGTKECAGGRHKEPKLIRSGPRETDSPPSVLFCPIWKCGGRLFHDGSNRESRRCVPSPAALYFSLDRNRSLFNN
jgi:hypothetical protein